MTEADRVFLTNVRRGLLSVASAIDKRLKEEDGAEAVPTLRDAILKSIEDQKQGLSRFADGVIGRGPT